MGLVSAQQLMEWWSLLQAKGLGKRVCDDPPTIQLTFEHKIGDQDLGQDAFYTASRDNCCVVCASKVHLLRYRVPPFAAHQAPLQPPANSHLRIHFLSCFLDNL